MKVDVHGLTVEQALKTISLYIDLAVKNGDRVLEISHGFNQGVRIKSKVLSLDKSFHPKIIRVRSHILNPGVSIIDLNIPSF